MKPRTRWRLSRKLIWSFSLLALVPIVVVGIGARQYTRTLLQRSLEHRVELTRRLVASWLGQLQITAEEAASLAATDPDLRQARRQSGSSPAELARQADLLLQKTGVDGIDIMTRQEGGLLLAARSGHPTHFGFPVQAPERPDRMTIWSTPELGAQSFGLTAFGADDSSWLVAAYFRVTPMFLSKLGGSGSFFVGSTTPDERPIATGGLEFNAWPALADSVGEMVQVEAAGQTYALGREGPFFYGLPLGENEAALRRLDLFLLVATLLAVLVAILAARRVALSAARPVEELADAVGQWGRGTKPTPLVTFARGETATLVDTFEHLRRELAAAEKRLGDYARAAGWQEMARKVAHEIKNPLTPIRITMEDLARRAAGSPSEAVTMIPDAARIIAEEVSVLGRIVDAFTRFARLPEPQPQPTDLGRVVSDVVSLQSAEAGATINVETSRSPLEVVLDPQLLGEALANLLKNAREAAGAEGRVTVRIAEEHGWGTIAVADSGPGFSDDLLSNGPRPYFTTKSQGTGLGLVISQKIITDMGGDLELDNTAEGARATMKFRVAAEENTP